VPFLPVAPVAPVAPAGPVAPVAPVGPLNASLLQELKIAVTAANTIRNLSVFMIFCIK
jgi:hypothetical protein